MFKAELKSIADYVLLYNKYFGKCFSNCMLDDDGCLFAELENGDTALIFPSDSYGDYFYIRQQRRAKFFDDGRFQMSQTTNHGTLVDGTALLVAIVSGADEVKLMTNLTNTLGKYSADKVRVIAAEWDKETIVRNELKGSEEEEIQEALKRLKDVAIVAIEFRLIMELPYQRIDCLTNPCK